MVIVPQHSRVHFYQDTAAVFAHKLQFVRAGGSAFNVRLQQLGGLCPAVFGKDIRFNEISACKLFTRVTGNFFRLIVTEEEVSLEVVHVDAVGRHLQGGPEQCLALPQGLLHPLAARNIGAHPKHRDDLAVVLRQGIFGGLVVMEFPGRLCAALFGDELHAARFEHLQIVPPALGRFIGPCAKLFVRLSDDILNRSLVCMRHGLVGQQKSARPVLDENEIGVGVDHLA